MEGKVEHKFDMKPHGENIEEYGRLCRERTSKSMIKNRQIRVGHLTMHCFVQGSSCCECFSFFPASSNNLISLKGH